MNIFHHRENTVRTYKSLYRNHIQDKTFDGTLNSINNLSARTIVAVLRMLKKHDSIEFDKRGLEKDLKYLSKDPGKCVKALTKDEATRLMNTCRVSFPDFYPILLLGLHAGLRRGEVFGLRKEDIDLKNKYIFIRYSYNGPTKSGRPSKAPMSPELEKSVKKRYNLTEGENNKLFPVINTNLILEAICKEAKVIRITFHQLRHTFADSSTRGRNES